MKGGLPMKAYTHSKRIYVPREAIKDLLENCSDDLDVWTILFANNMTLIVKPTTQAEREFYREEKMIREEIQKCGIDDAVLWKNRWSV